MRSARAVLYCLLATGTTQSLAAALFEADGVLETVLTGPMRDLVRDARRGDETEFPFTLEVAGKAIDVEVRARGKSRREACTFPPLRLDLAKAGADGTPFEGQNKLKLVTHCRESARFEEFVLEEYALYRILNVLTPDSFRVRLLRVTYREPGATGDTHNAFVIESDSELARRMGGEIAEVEGLSSTVIDPVHATTVAVFQYLIGNFDYSLIGAPPGESCCHNAQPISIGGTFRVVPYDFDLAGVIKVPYASPNPELGVRNVRDRVYRGFCVDEAVMDGVLEKFRAAESQILGLYDAVPGLSPKEIEDQRKYLEGFFRILGDPKKVNREIVRACR